MTNPIAEHHRNYLETLTDQYGLSILKEICYRIANFENTTKISRDFSIPMYDLRFLMQIPNETTVYFYSKEHRPQLTLVYTKQMAA